jgi:hypothetical protein
MSKAKTGRARFRQLALIILLLTVFAGTALSNEKSTKIMASSWGKPQSSKEILAMRPLASIMRKLTKNPETTLHVLYPGDDKGIKWANDLRGWLVSLGLKSERIIMSPDSYREDIIELKIQ